MKFPQDYLTHDGAAKCVRCGFVRQGEKRFRYYRRGLSVCDECFTGHSVWIVGPGYYGVPAVSDFPDRK